MNKRLFELKKELRQIKHMMIRNNKYADKHGLYRKCWMDYDWGLYSNYEIITSDGCSYILGIEDDTFPDVDFTKIVYICAEIVYASWKKNGKIYSTNRKYSHYDTVNGFFNIKDDYAYLSKIHKKFKIYKFIYNLERV